MKNRVATRSLILGVIASMAFLASCAKESENNNMTTALAAALVTESSRSYDAMPLVPASLASSKDSGGVSSVQSVINDAVPQGTATDRLKQIFAPVRGSILIGKEVVQFGGKLITEVERLIAQHPTLASGATITYNDNSDAAHPGHVAKLTADSTFGGSGYKVELWWDNSGTDIRTGKKILELIYEKNGDNIDGVLFFRHLPTESSTDFALVRVEFKKAVVGSDITRTAYVYVENYIDFNNIPGAKAAFFITENPQGIVTVEGGYTVTGLKMPFLDANTTGGDWDATDQRVYLFNGAGSIASGKAVVNVVLPLRSQSGDVDVTGAPFANGELWSLGELFTDGLLSHLDSNTETFGEFGIHTLLWVLNLISDSTLDTNSTQDEIITALNSIDLSLWGTQAAQIISDLKVIAGIKNPVYFQKTAFSINLVGQLNTSGLDEASVYGELQVALPTNFIKFTLDELFVLDIETGTSVDLIPGHVGIEAWTGDSLSPI